MGWKIALLLLASASAASVQAADLAFSSEVDFTKMVMLLKDDQGPNPDLVELSLVLTPAATERAKAISHEAMGQPLNLSINGQHISTATVRSELGGEFRISMSRSVAKRLLPTLID